MRKYKYALWLVISFLIGGNGALSAQNNPLRVDSPASMQGMDYDYLFMEAVRLKVGGEVNQAAVLFQKCLEINPRAAAPYYQLSDILAAQQNLPAALILAKQAVRFSEENKHYQLHLARIYQGLQFPDSSLLVLNRLIIKNPEDPDLKMNLISFYFDQGDFEAALPLLDSLEKTTGFSNELVMAKYQANVQLNRKEEALKILLGAVENSPENPVFIGSLAELYIALDQQDKALEQYQKLMQIDPDHVIGNLSMVNFLFNKGDHLSGFTKSKQIVENPRMAFEVKFDLMLDLLSDTLLINKFPDQLDSLNSSFQRLYPDQLQARILNVDYHIRMGRLEEAKADLIYLTERNKDNYTIWAQLAYVLNSTNDYPALIRTTTQAISLFPEKANLYLMKAFAEMQIKDYASCVMTLKSSLHYLGNGKESQAQVYAMLGEAYNGLKEYSLSDDFFELAIDLAPENLVTLNNYAYYLSLRGENLSRAQSFIKKCLESDPESGTYLDTAAWIYYKSGKPKEALAFIEKAFQFEDGKSPEVCLHYIEILLANDEKKEAKNLFNQLKKQEKFIQSEEFVTAENLIKNGKK
ncbi:MAG: tetratricopeptide repeat protein [Bacteroidales bacterium]|nr:tetratricopeptide repeat protein [Bacteroidales bacterium]